jgi:hypothetical protein
MRERLAQHGPYRWVRGAPFFLDRHSLLQALKFGAKIMGGIPMKRSLEKYINRENIKNLKKRLAAPADQVQRQTLLKLLADEITKSEQLRKAEDKGTQP